MPEKRYEEKRDFEKTPEPEMRVEAREEGPLTFVIQKHDATRLHYDLRLELDGVLKSWAVPKGPSYDPKEKRLAMEVEDHPLDYGGFEGVIPEGNYGAGEVIVWDRGIYSPDEDGRLLFYDRAEAQKEMRKGFKKGKISVFLRGSKLTGSWALVKMKGKNEWLFFKHNDEYANSDKEVLDEEQSVISGLTIEDLKHGKTPEPLQRQESAETDPSKIAGAKKAKIPKNLLPMGASIAESPFSNPDWLFEPKLDGIRALATIQDGSVLLITRKGNDICRQYPGLVDELTRQPLKEAVIDGEIVAFDAENRPSFHQLQQRMNLQRDPDIRVAEKQVPVFFFAFDVLHLNGYDLRGVELEKRKEILHSVLIKTEHVSVLEHFIEHGKAAYKAATDHGFEGIVAKKRNSRYETGKRTAQWLKIKAVASDEFVIGGYTKGQGSRQDTFGSLLLGVYDDGKLRYVGNVGSGFNDESLQRHLEDFQKLKSAKNPFSSKPPVKDITFMQPKLVAEVKYTQYTPDGHLRAPVFLRMREDVDPAQVTGQKPVPTPTDEEPEISSANCDDIGDILDQLEQKKKEFFVECQGHRLKISNADKMLWPATDKHPGLSKRDLLIYFAKVSEYLLPHLRDRPMTLSRYPNGIDGGMFYQKHWEHKLPEFVETVQLYSEHYGEDQEYMLCNNLPSLLWLGQLADLELHPWTSRTNPEGDAENLSTVFTGSEENIDESVLNYPDYLLFDLDPYIYSGKEDKGAEPEFNQKAFDKGREAAFWFKEILDSLKLNSFIKTSGKTGLHIYVPILRQFTYDQTRSAAATLCNFVLREHPKDVTTEWAVIKRTGKIFLDYNQNTRGKTLSSIYSPRALPLATVSVPVTWDELANITPTEFTMQTVPERLKKRGDLWKNILQKKNDLRSIIG